ncbi:hypothetical protein SNE40_012154 [Patella caerulea]|uniref:NodB homology domain-containing protein n=1 Tax=Patella caerulea TaxID=87958 RepID=A0AAN8JPT0_PATCE
MKLLIIAVLCFVVGGVWSLASCRQGSNCRLPDCLCFGYSNQVRDIKKYPQIVYFGFDDAVTSIMANHYRYLFPPDRKNPNNCPITMSLYIQHKYTDYAIVNEMYKAGMEIGVHSVTHNNIDTKAKLLDEATQQRLNLHKRAKVPLDEIVGWRSPNLKTAGDDQPDILQQIGYTYDVSLTYTRRVLGDTKPLPYTLDYGNPMPCMIEPCPLKGSPHKGFWEIPINSLTGIKQQYPCPYVDGCYNRPENGEEAFQYLYQNFADYYEGNREPLGFHMHAAWFETLHNKLGMDRFIKYMVSLPDVYIVTAKQMLDWVQNPVPISRLHTLPSWSCRSSTRNTIAPPPPRIQFPSNEISKPIHNVASNNPQRSSMRPTNNRQSVAPVNPSRIMRPSNTRQSVASRTPTRTMQPLIRMTSKPKYLYRPTTPSPTTPKRTQAPKAPQRIWWGGQTERPLPQSQYQTYRPVHQQPPTKVTRQYIRNTPPPTTRTMTMAPIKRRNPFFQNRQPVTNNRYNSGSSIRAPLQQNNQNTRLTADNAQCVQGDNCRLPDCLCRTTAPPRGLLERDTPQMVYFAFDGPIEGRVYSEYISLFDPSRKNPDGCPISATLFVAKNGNYITYLQNLANRGFEVALRGGHRGAYKDIGTLETDLDQELSIMKQYLPNSTFTGWRSPATKPLGDGQYQALEARRLTYDSTLIIASESSQDTMPWPYTLDFGWKESCYALEGCPNQSYRGLWEVPLYTVRDYLDKFNCIYADGCMQNPTTAEETFQFLLSNFLRHYNGNRVPFGINLRHLWFSHNVYVPNKAGLDKFIRYLVEIADVYIVNINQLLDWMRNPTPLSQLKSYQPWICPTPYTQ